MFGLCGAGSIGIAGFGLDIRECDDAFGWRSVFCVMYRRRLWAICVQCTVGGGVR